MTDLQFELRLDEGDHVWADIWTILSGRRIPLWLTSDIRHEVLITQVTSDGGTPPRITVLAHCDRDLGELPNAVEPTFIGWRVESLTER